MQQFNNKKSIIALSLILLFIIGFLFFLYKNFGQILKSDQLSQLSQKVQEEMGPPKKEKLKIGYTTDAHCYAKEEKSTEKWILNWRCIRPLNKFIPQMNEQYHPDVVIDGGDLIDGKDKRVKGDLIDVLAIYRNITAPKHYVLGNHEVRGITKQEWMETTGQERTYYHFDIDNFRVIILDANFYPDQATGDTKDVDPEHWYDRGYMNQQQLNWLEKLLGRSKKYRTLVFVHQVPLEKTTIRKPGKLLGKGEELRNILSKHKVEAVFSGHIEELCDLKINGVKYYTLQGFWKGNSRLEKKDQFKHLIPFYEITITDNIEVKMYYQERSGENKTLIVNQETAICNNQSIRNIPEERAEENNE